ncbi:unnamed protein product [Coccothraustes coccothraustes]
MFGDWKGTVLDVFEGCAENASYVRLRSSSLSSGHAVRLPQEKKRLLRALSIVPVAVLSKARLLLKAACDRPLASGIFRLKGTAHDVFEGCAENASYVRLRSSRLSIGRAVWLPEAKKRLLRALSIVFLVVLSKAGLLPKAARDRRLASGSFRLGCAENASYVRLRSSRLRSGRAVRLPVAKKRLLRALSSVLVAVLFKARLLLKAARDRRLTSGRFRLVCSAFLSACIFPERFSTFSHTEKL